MGIDDFLSEEDFMPGTYLVTFLDEDCNPCEVSFDEDSFMDLQSAWNNFVEDHDELDESQIIDVEYSEE